MNKLLWSTTAQNSNGSLAGALDAENFTSTNNNNSNKYFGHETIVCFLNYGLAPYFACAKLYTFPTIPAYSPAPLGLQSDLTTSFIFRICFTCSLLSNF